MPLRFSADFSEPELDVDPFIDEVFGELKSGFLELPRGEGFVEYPVFETGYQALKRATSDFTAISAEAIIPAVYECPIAFIVLRTILGFTPSEWADVASERSDLKVDQGAARALDREIRLAPLTPLKENGLKNERRKVMIAAAVAMLADGAKEADHTLVIHRLDKVDTVQGFDSIRPVADLGVPYPVLLYERFLGRPFAGHRDSVSELVGDVVESAVEDVLAKAGG